MPPTSSTTDLPVTTSRIEWASEPEARDRATSSSASTMPGNSMSATSAGK